ncbi:(2Fe-2S)-binding protein [Parahaliea aestuarii]|uniref:(2Fe-2S)-binding protein n=1 Tax=Parahaliea aestuarii TaxID=1852021 RepID=A0A5C8ZSX1_9GAMM|nr:(2Fe-2S)-binding protein [Parahaliea aestuarii]TXS91556.1 (2Fe-2S)-binding protein [Parahaliea aestuarii]
MKLKVNGRAYETDADADTPLLWILRDELKLTGTRYGCGDAICGACTVHFNGVPTRACRLPLSAASEGDITTIEGLSEDGSHPVQEAWRRHNVPQCGFCQAGQIMSASALLARNASPSDDDIDSAMSGNICRCGTYPRIRAAIHDVAKQGEDAS